MGQAGESEKPLPAGLRTRAAPGHHRFAREFRMTWAILLSAVAIFIVLPALSFLITLKVQNKN
jgi:cell division protein FtsX